MYGRHIIGSAVSVRCPELGGFKCISSTVVLFCHRRLSAFQRLSASRRVRYERFHCIQLVPTCLHYLLALYNYVDIEVIYLLAIKSVASVSETALLQSITASIGWPYVQLAISLQKAL